MVLRLLDAGEPEPHGAVLRDALEAETGRVISPGALYNTLDRLERRQLVSSRLGDPSPVRGGKRRRHYCLLPAGRVALHEAHVSLMRLVEAFSATRKP